MSRSVYRADGLELSSWWTFPNSTYAVLIGTGVTGEGPSTATDVAAAEWAFETSSIGEGPREMPTFAVSAAEPAVGGALPESEASKLLLLC